MVLADGWEGLERATLVRGLRFVPREWGEGRREGVQLNALGNHAQVVSQSCWGASVRMLSGQQSEN